MIDLSLIFEHLNLKIENKIEQNMNICVHSFKNDLKLLTKEISSESNKKEKKKLVQGLTINMKQILFKLENFTFISKFIICNFRKNKIHRL